MYAAYGTSSGQLKIPMLWTQHNGWKDDPCVTYVPLHSKSNNKIMYVGLSG